MLIKAVTTNPDIGDKNKDKNQLELDPMPTLHSPSTRIHPIDIEAITMRPIYCNLHIRTTDITNFDQQTPPFALSQPTKPPTTDASKLLTALTTPHLTTVDDPWNPVKLTTTTSDNHSNTARNELLIPKSQLDTNTNQQNDPKTQQKRKFGFKYYH